MHADMLAIKMVFYVPMDKMQQKYTVDTAGRIMITYSVNYQKQTFPSRIYHFCTTDYRIAVKQS
jgi:imidazoleglycerol phosphate dehydratase HisB